MFLHIPTLLLALLLGFALLTLQLGVADRRLRARPELRLWTQGCWALLVGFIGLSSRAALPLAASILIGNAAMVLGMALWLQALYRLLCDRPAPRGLWAGVGLACLLLLVMLPWPQYLRTAVMSFVYMVLAGQSVWLIGRHGWQAERALRTVFLTLLMAAIALGARMLHALLRPEEYGHLMQPSLGQGLTFLMAFMSLLGAGFGFVLAVFERVARQMEVMATVDGLTGCLNRSTTDEMLAHALRLGRRDGQPVAFVLLDLDHFKQVNDRHGHRMGDTVLRAFAEAVRQRLRASDVFGRTGGEEFGLVLPGTDAQGARHLVEAVRRNVEAMRLADGRGQPVAVTVSAGVAVATGDADVSADRLYGRADQALYEAKHAGRNRVALYGASSVQPSLLPDLQ